MKKNKTLQHHLEYYALNITMFFLHLFPMSFSKKIGLMLADIAFVFVPIRKKHIINSLTEAFPDKSQEEIIKIAKDVYKQFVITIVEIIYFPKMSRKELKNFVNFENIYLVENAVKKGKGAIMLSAHYGNWELLAISFAQRYPLSVVVAQQENLLVDKMIDDIRSGKGYNTIYKDKAPIGVLRALRRNEFVAILADQDAGSQGVFVPYFSKKASTAKGPAVFALRAQCPIIVSFCIRQPDGRYVATFEEIELPEGNDTENNIEIIMTKYSSMLEKNVREHPSYWFWFHKRWKTKEKNK